MTSDACSNPSCADEPRGVAPGPRRAAPARIPLGRPLGDPRLFVLARRLALFGLLACGSAIAVTPDAATDAAPSAVPDVTAEQHYRLALEARTTGDFRVMAVHLRRAAAAGELPAQELLAVVLVDGPGLHGNAVPPDRCEALWWARRAAAAGSAIGRHQMLLLNAVRGNAC